MTPEEQLWNDLEWWWINEQWSELELWREFLNAEKADE